MSGNQNLVAMKRADGTVDSDIFLADGSVVKPDEAGRVLVHRDDVMGLMMAGYFYSQT
jgi:hypothetical protein